MCEFDAERGYCPTNGGSVNSAIISSQRNYSFGGESFRRYNGRNGTDYSVSYQ
jgi:hypothetical protein